MAGISLDLQRYLKKDNYIGLISAYSYAGVISSGPWLLSILTILFISILGRVNNIPFEATKQFIIVTVYLIAGSLILSSSFQHTYTRYVANICFIKEPKRVVSAFNSIMTCMIALSGVLGLIFTFWLLPDEPVAVKLVTTALFIVFCMIWISTSVSAGLQAYRTIVEAFLAGFLFSVLFSAFVYSHGMLDLLTSLLCGQFLLLIVMVANIYHSFPTNEQVNYSFFNFKQTRIPLLFTGLFYNVAIWIDKFIFWYSPLTGEAVIGKLHLSIPYDFPIFLAYLATIPGLTLFLLHIETDYAEAHEELYRRVCSNSTFDEIVSAYKDLLEAGKTAIYSIIKAQSYVLLLGVTVGLSFFYLLNTSILYLPTFLVCFIGASLNVIFWSLLNIIFYLDKLYHALFLTLFFLITNALFTYWSIQLGIYYYGYGLAVSLLITVILTLIVLNKDFGKLKYETYMLQ